MPFTSMVIRADGSASPCCQNTHSAARPDGEKIHFYKDRLQDAYDSPFFREIRADMLAGKRHPSCQECWNIEDKGIYSKRRHENKVFWKSRRKILKRKPLGQPIDLSLNLGNQCNLKCRICGPTSSSRWASEYVALFGEDHVPRENPVIQSLGLEESRSLLTNWPYQDQNFTNDMLTWLPKVTRLEFLGGEPFLNKKQFELVKTSAANGWAKKQKLTFVTNGSTYPDDLAIRDWGKFREANVHVSIDGTDDQFEYQRYGAKWADVEKHIARYRALPEVSSVNIMLTASIFNIYYLPEIYTYWKEKDVEVTDWLPNSGEDEGISIKGLFLLLGRLVSSTFLKSIAYHLRTLFFKRPSRLHTSYVYNPHRFDIRVLPPALKDAVAKKFREFPAPLTKAAKRQLEIVVDQMYAEDLSHLWPKTLESIWFHDGYRKQKFAETFPEFHAEATRLGVWYDYETQKEYFFPDGIPAPGQQPRSS